MPSPELGTVVDGNKAIVKRAGCQDAAPDCAVLTAKGHCNRFNSATVLHRCLDTCGACDAPYLIDLPPNVELQKGIVMPRIGFGTAALGDQTADIVLNALSAGFRKLDTAQAPEWYREDLVGLALSMSGIHRRELFITTKVHPRDFGVQATIDAVKQSLRNLRTSYIDVVMLHYPHCWGNLCGDKVPQGTWQDSWRALERLIDQGVIRCAGVSNFDVHQVEELMGMAQKRPCLLQAASEPLHPNTQLQAVCRFHGLQFEGYSTLGGQYIPTNPTNPVLTHPTVEEIAKDKGQSTASIVLRWALQSGQTVVPRSTKAAHMLENLATVTAFNLSAAEMLRMDSIGVGNS